MQSFVKSIIRRFGNFENHGSTCTGGILHTKSKDFEFRVVSRHFNDIVIAVEFIISPHLKNKYPTHNNDFQCINKHVYNGFFDKSFVDYDNRDTCIAEIDNLDLTSRTYSRKESGPIRSRILIFKVAIIPVTVQRLGRYENWSNSWSNSELRIGTIIPATVQR
jgi:hypothetical protein